MCRVPAVMACKPLRSQGAVLRTYGRLRTVRRIQTQTWLSPADQKHLFSSSSSLLSSSQEPSSSCDPDFSPPKHHRARGKAPPSKKAAEPAYRKRKKKGRSNVGADVQEKENGPPSERKPASSLTISTPFRKFVTVRRKAPTRCNSVKRGRRTQAKNKAEHTIISSDSTCDFDLSRPFLRKKRKLCPDIGSILRSPTEISHSPLQKSPLLSSTPSVLLRAGVGRQKPLCETLEESVVRSCPAVKDQLETFNTRQEDFEPIRSSRRATHAQHLTRGQCAKDSGTDTRNVPDFISISSQSDQRGLPWNHTGARPSGNGSCLLLSSFAPVTISSSVSQSVICLDEDHHKGLPPGPRSSHVLCLSSELFSEDDFNSEAGGHGDCGASDHFLQEETVHEQPLVDPAPVLSFMGVPLGARSIKRMQPFVRLNSDLVTQYFQSRNGSSISALAGNRAEHHIVVPMCQVFNHSMVPPGEAGERSQGQSHNHAMVPPGEAGERSQGQTHNHAMAPPGEAGERSQGQSHNHAMVPPAEAGEKSHGQSHNHAMAPPAEAGERSQGQTHNRARSQEPSTCSWRDLSIREMQPVLRLDPNSMTKCFLQNGSETKENLPTDAELTWGGQCQQNRHPETSILLADDEADTCCPKGGAEISQHRANNHPARLQCHNSNHTTTKGWAHPPTGSSVGPLQPVVRLDPSSVPKYFLQRSTVALDPHSEGHLPTDPSGRKLHKRLCASPLLESITKTPNLADSHIEIKVQSCRTRAQETVGTGRKVCISGFSAKRWGNRLKKTRAQQQLSFRDSSDLSLRAFKELDPSLAAAQSPSSLLLSSSLWNSSFMNSSAVMNMSLSPGTSGPRDPQRERRHWLRLRAALSLHRKKKVQATEPLIHPPERSLHFALYSPQSLNASLTLQTSSLLLLSSRCASAGADDLSDAEKVYLECQQDGPIPFSSCLTQAQLACSQKIGEGAYGEVFRTFRGELQVALKVIPIEGTHRVNGEEQKCFSEILPEIIISKELSLLNEGKENRTNGFISLHSAHCVKGCYPPELLRAWDQFAEEKGTENERPDMFSHEQLFMILEFEFGGTDLENCQLPSVAVARSVLHQVTVALAVAEEELRFEHRDLHWGNLLIETCSSPTITASLHGDPITIPTSGVQVKIIDYTLSRLDKDGLTVFCDLSADEELFLGEGDLQFDIYRAMREENKNAWSAYGPHSNVLWLHYLADKLLSAVRYTRKPSSAPQRRELRKLQDLRREIRKFGSAGEVLGSKLFR
uniref:Serine/threonine-protein kinase haspin n=1 Tax=Xenopus tropicalis TaxID=8364 RepID=A0A803JAD5_XENTR